MPRHICIHGHFYQPPRLDPWLRTILPEGSAAPARHWNERICAESYAPLGRARRMNGQGRVLGLVNAYEWISFNTGPTLLSWMRDAAPDAYARMLAGDAASIKRWGHGNAMAQVYHHIILPLATEQEKRVQVAWAVADFRARYGRDPEGMWLAETAADTASLEALAAAGIRFTVLAPRQAAAVCEPDGDWQDVNESSLDVRRPYRVALPSGREIAVFFYHGPLSQAVAFERLLENGEQFRARLAGEMGDGLLSLSTDGETYGHHFTFGEMALAYVLHEAAQGRGDMALTNYAAYLAEHPAQAEVRLHEPSSWSCVHGVERWRSDCGCSTGGHAGWNQAWRAPLRQGLRRAKDDMDAHFQTMGRALFLDQEAALDGWGQVLADAWSREEFAARHMPTRSTGTDKETAFALLEMQEWSLASFASCAWFFDELSRIEPVNGLTCCLRAMELCRATGGPNPEPALLVALDSAQCNRPGKGTGRELFEREVRPRAENGASLTMQALARMDLARGTETGGDAPSGHGTPALAEIEGTTASVASWPGVRVHVETSSCDCDTLSGTATIQWLHGGVEKMRWLWRRGQGASPDLSGRPFAVSRASGPQGPEIWTGLDALPWNKRQALALEAAEAAQQAAWTEQVRSGAALVRLFPEQDEAQQAPNATPSWQRLWPGLAWALAQGRGPEPDTAAHEFLCAFLADTPPAPHQRTWLENHMQARAARLLENDPPDIAGCMSWVCAVEALRPVLGLDLQWRAAQERLWDMDVTLPKHRELALLLGFADTVSS